MKKILRMGYNSYFLDKVFERNLKLVSENLDVIDEITLFTEPTHHGYWTVERCKETCGVLRDRIKRYKEAGVKRVGINVLCTLGHTEDGARIAPRSDMQYVMNIDGATSESCLCPSDDRFHEYISERYYLYADVGADFIWLDDDMRIMGHGIMREYCFCPKCVEKYNERFNTGHTVQEVRELYKTDSAFKARWILSAEKTMARLFATVKTAIRRVNSDIDIGYMSGPSNSRTDWIVESGAVLGRPGGGFYNDLTPTQIFEKLYLIEEQILNYPVEIKDIQYEYEEYNFLTLQKSKHIAELESSLMILGGCNGMLYNRWEHTEDFLEVLRGSKRKWDLLEEYSRGARRVGVYCATRLNSKALSEIGIPTTIHKDLATAFFILGNEWYKYDRAEIERMLSVGVYTDAIGLTRLREKGFSDLGGEVGTCHPNGVWEHFTEHSINGDHSDRERFVSLDIFKEADAYELHPDESACVISRLNSAFLGIGSASAYVYRRKDGSCIAVDGCLMPKQLATANKKTQMTNVFDLISGAGTPVVIDKSIKVAPIVTSNGKNAVIMLINAHLDPTGEFDLRVRLGKNFSFLTKSGELVQINCTEASGERIISIPSLGAWEYHLIVCDI